MRVVLQKNGAMNWSCNKLISTSALSDIVCINKRHIVNRKHFITQRREQCCSCKVNMLYKKNCQICVKDVEEYFVAQ